MLVQSIDGIQLSSSSQELFLGTILRFVNFVLLFMQILFFTLLHVFNYINCELLCTLQASDKDDKHLMYI